MFSLLSSGLTKDVDFNGGSGTALAVGGLYDVGGAVVSLGLCDANGRVSWLGVDGHPVIRFEYQVSLGPFHPGFWLTSHLGWEFDLAASLGGKTGQQFGVQLDLWRLCRENENERSFRNLKKTNTTLLSLGKYYKTFMYPHNINAYFTACYYVCVWCRTPSGVHCW